MRTRLAAVVSVSLLAACTGASPGSSTRSNFSVQPLPRGSRPSPLVAVQSGSVQAAVPDSWEARPLVDARFPREGFVAAPRMKEWERGATTARGMEVFWVDIAKVGIPSDYYYLAARGPALTSLHENKSCEQATRRVFVNRPPDLTGKRFSPSDYVASGTATCRAHGRSTHWAYLVAAPGYGPVRHVGIRTSGLYVVRVAVSGPRAKALLREIIDSTRFGNASVPQILNVARTIA